jgi:hypothetical protein
MAEFCKQCADALGFNPEHGIPYDFDGLGPLPPEHGHVVMCEGCGPTLVDERGACMLHNRGECMPHGSVL